MTPEERAAEIVAAMRDEFGRPDMRRVGEVPWMPELASSLADGFEWVVAAVAAAIRDAVAAGRERCARVADEHADWWKEQNSGTDADFADGEDESRYIAARIREGGAA